MVAKKGEPECLVPNCSCPQFARGQCSTCYRRTLRYVQSGKYTWKYFERKGWARKKGSPGRPRTNNLDKALERNPKEV